MMETPTHSWRDSSLGDKLAGDGEEAMKILEWWSGLLFLQGKGLSRLEANVALPRTGKMVLGDMK